MKGLGTILFIGLVLWLLSQRQEVKAAPLVLEPSLYELMRTKVPITERIEKEIPIFGSFTQ